MSIGSQPQSRSSEAAAELWNPTGKPGHRRLIGLLDPAATVTTDGGGNTAAAPHPIEGAGRIVRYLADLAARTPGNVRFLERTVNGQPGLVAQLDGVTGAVYAFEAADDNITNIWAIFNHAKLRPWTTR